MTRINLSSFSAPKVVVGCVAFVLFHCSAFGQGVGLRVIRGTISNDRAEPVPNARVDISTAAPVFGPAVFCPSCYLDCQKWTTTDETGRFQITDLDSRLRFRLVVSAAGYKTAQTKLIAPGEKLNELTLYKRPKAIDYQRVVQGTVKNEFGVAVQGALVSPRMTIDESGLRSSSSKGVSPAVTDATGHFEIDLVDGVSGVDVKIDAEGLCSRVFAGLSPLAERQVYELLEGAHVTGYVERNGRPVQGMTVSVAQTDHSSKGEKFFQKPVPTVTNPQGKFEFKNLLPDQEYCVYTVVGEADRSDSTAVIKTQKFTTPSSGRSLDIGGLTTHRSVSFSGRLVLSDHQAFEELDISLGRRPAWDLIKVPVASDGSFRIDGLPPEVYEIRIMSNQFELEASKIDSLLWTEKSIKKLVDKSIDNFVLPVCLVEPDARDADEQNGTQTLKGRVTLPGGKGESRIVVSANDGNSPKTSTSDDGSFTLEFPVGTDWIKLYRPDPDGMRFWYLGRFKPMLGNNDVNIQLGRETTYEPATLSAQHQ